ncbi:CPBP family intramembrane glutamic endopeptidase [Natranaeroarchaeum sulfidigenes]|uniref:Metal-dependent membrane protease, CAAX family n=1 Tax=Natranaeroarchaeum sulfidigenes TaxID=2784880 RepID=A0A897MIP2_9EURY|nr:type II CAAX endopeptidase family protein [Natranaeroarchaeum sulfidigenes]QSG01990.1 Metal-dependent membrane protease, CAAX family [Natranaeroarchaeum sulfidigenes]
MSDWNEDGDDWGVDDDPPEDGDGWGVDDPPEDGNDWHTTDSDDPNTDGFVGDTTGDDDIQSDGDGDRSLLRITAVSIGLVIGAFLIGTVTAVIILVALQGVGVPVFEDLVLLSVISTVTLQGIGMLGISAWYMSRQGYGLEFIRLRMPTLREVGWVFGGILGAFAASIGVQSALAALGYEGSEHEVVEMATANPEILLVMIPLSFLLIGPGEELLFRGLIQTKFVNRSGVLPGLVLASVLFAVVHIPAYGGFDSMPTIIGLFFISLVLGGLYEYTENLFVPIVIHGAFNAIQFGALYVVLTTDGEMPATVASLLATIPF